MSKLKTLGVNLGLTLGGLLMGVVIGEIGLRVARVEGYPKIGDVVDSAPTRFHTSDRDLGWKLKPGVSGEWNGEGVSFVQVNSDGLRDREHTKTKPPNTLRVAVLGDSFTEAIQVPVEQTFWSKLERKLGNCGAVKGRKKVEVINFGVQGYGTAQELMMLRKKVWDYSPDIVVLAFFIGNDVINNSPQLEYDHYRPFFVYDASGKLVPDMSFRNLPPIARNERAVSFVDRMPSFLVNNSRILQVIKKVDLDRKKRQLSGDFTALSSQNFNPPQDAVWKDAWRVTEGLIVTMRNEVVQKKADFLVVTIGDPMQVLGDVKVRKDLMTKHNIQDLYYPDRRLEKLGEREGFRVLNLAEQFKGYTEKYQVCAHGFDNSIPCGGHWNELGHRLASILINRNLCENLQQSQVPKK
ncbi:MAG: SGNH/GDSL hydrolase family protein [Microcoleus sp. PH2017_07_MST_O_A]|uniref:SGNH/GDSL hydrolase family protein n=1 Tax=Microcoleus sp. PH2017_08_TRC_O_A TaxID=2798819 RepID=UPI001DBED6CE|nr:SGNH/GDSL hydrolase family protein [Microcoleus sp. PH2017_08_TRC_O_A]MCC3419471.1 SGNH/GDSL hydrolase family protein [Microcoleus sp. PH2017_07_MST_O_A]MCC3468061.1 SGNH/GDSL hydrolase family protein [Microcoleus sp. PH2017_06_SFM_O_A]MCC3510758.1 SGNH/GDSL hydrolase family protein [Microcoleus sp. PH2017_17_BER_D_A]TAE07019.1 MAG: SGNH/GDSL hydrolase family protein [Oscillatoriales cyanobacterium]MCC3454340.1 SGNH/GDSL hydrolase family protein [Microcoleus sp. PH2017_08_TRC_O_A]